MKYISTKMKFVLLWLFLIISFSTLAVFIVLEANGYRFNKQIWKLQQTGLIVIDGYPKNAIVEINGKVAKTSLPYKSKKLLPGFYELSISNQDYLTWTKLIKVEPGQVFEDKKIRLFLSNIVPVESAKSLSNEQIEKETTNQSSQLQINDFEIWFNDILVTRFSSTPNNAILTSDKNHIIFQLDKDVRVIDLDGSNNHLLFQLPVEDKTTFALFDDRIIYNYQEKTLEAKIR